MIGVGASVQSAAGAQRAFRSLAAAVRGAGRLNGVMKGAAVIERNAKARIPTSTERAGRANHVHLRDTVGVRLYSHTPGATTAGVGTDDVRGIFLEKGVRPHTITPRSAGALWWEGAWHPVGHVEHPGYTARPWLKPAADESAPAVLRAMGEEIRDSARRGGV